MRFKQPFYTIYVYELSAGEVWINDIPVLNWSGSITSDGMYNGAIPINHIILQNGGHELECRLKPRFDYKAFNQSNAHDVYDIGVNCREKSDINSKIEVIPRIQNPYAKWNEKKQRFVNETFKELPLYIAKTKFEVDNLSFILNGWQNSLILLDLDEEKLFQDVLKFYYQLHGILSSHNASKFLELSKEKMQLQEEAFYFSKARKSSFLESATKLFNQKLEILPLEASNLKLQIMGYGKLVRLIRLDGSAALQYKTPDAKIQDNIEFDVKLHMRSLDKGLSII